MNDGRSIERNSDMKKGSKKKKRIGGKSKAGSKSALKKSMRGKHKKSVWALIIGVPIVVAAGIFLFCITYMVFGNYDGLGKSAVLDVNEYSKKHMDYSKEYPEYGDKKFRSEPGIDVSVFQGDIDWKKVKASGIKFVMIKIGYSGSDTGRIFDDANYQKNLEGAKAAGLKVGVYFFSQATTTDEAVEEAKYVVRKIRDRGIEYPVAFDMEHVENSRIKDLTVRERTEITDAFCTIIKKNNFTPMIYGNPSWLSNSIDMTYLTSYGTWLAHYAKWPDYDYKFSMWQYTEKGKIPGISKRVDINLRFISKH